MDTSTETLLPIIGIIGILIYFILYFVIPILLVVFLIKIFKKRKKQQGIAQQQIAQNLSAGSSDNPVFDDIAEKAANYLAEKIIKGAQDITSRENNCGCTLILISYYALGHTDPGCINIYLANELSVLDTLGPHFSFGNILFQQPGVVASDNEAIVIVRTLAAMTEKKLRAKLPKDPSGTEYTLATKEIVRHAARYVKDSHSGSVSQSGKMSAIAISYKAANASYQAPTPPKSASEFFGK